MYDNQIFDVNGRGDEMLLSALELVFEQDGAHVKATGYLIDPTRGMVLMWIGGDKDVTPFPSPLLPRSLLPVVTEWLASKPEIECKDWDSDRDHDGHNSLGWRVYCEDWGHVADSHRAICAVKPAYLWHGK